MSGSWTKRAALVTRLGPRIGEVNVHRGQGIVFQVVPHES